MKSVKSSILNMDFLTSFESCALLTILLDIIRDSLSRDMNTSAPIIMLEIDFILFSSDKIKWNRTQKPQSG
jgi:hypothetical protein